MFRDHGIDPFDAILVDERLPELFHEKRLPQMRENIGRKRAKLTPRTS